MKHYRKLFTVALAYLFLLSSGTTTSVMAAASGNYTDLLPIGAPSDTTVISRGSGWAITTLAPSQTFGDALSRAPMTVYQSTGTRTINATTAFSTFTFTQGSVGSTTFPAAWVAIGRSIRVITYGVFSTVAAGPTWTWAVNLGTTTAVTTGALSSPGGNANQFYRAEAILTIATTGSAGTINGSYAIFVSSGVGSAGTSVLNYSTTTLSAVTVDLTTQLTVNPGLTWGTANSSFTVKNCTIEFLN